MNTFLSYGPRIVSVVAGAGVYSGWKNSNASTKFSLLFAALYAGSVAVASTQFALPAVTVMTYSITGAACVKASLLAKRAWQDPKKFVLECKAYVILLLFAKIECKGNIRKFFYIAGEFSVIPLQFLLNKEIGVISFANENKVHVVNLSGRSIYNGLLTVFLFTVFGVIAIAGAILGVGSVMPQVVFLFFASGFTIYRIPLLHLDPYTYRVFMAAIEKMVSKEFKRDVLIASSDGTQIPKTLGALNVPKELLGEIMKYTSLADTMRFKQWNRKSYELANGVISQFATHQLKQFPESVTQNLSEGRKIAFCNAPPLQLKVPGKLFSYYFDTVRALLGNMSVLARFQLSKYDDPVIRHEYIDFRETIKDRDCAWGVTEKEEYFLCFRLKDNAKKSHHFLFLFQGENQKATILVERAMKYDDFGFFVRIDDFEDFKMAISDPRMSVDCDYIQRLLKGKACELFGEPNDSPPRLSLPPVTTI